MSNSEHQGALPKSLRVLIVEDEPNTGQAVQRFLQFRGHEVKVAQDASRAIQMADDMAPEVLVCDWRLAGNDDGVDVAGRIRSRRDIPVIIVTGHSLDHARRKAKESHVKIEVFRRKPVSLPDLASLIESLGLAS
jgi:CheY-like chemotaxis protein